MAKWDEIEIKTVPPGSIYHHWNPSSELREALCKLLGVENLNNVKRVVVDMDINRADIHVYTEQLGEDSAVLDVLRATTSPVIQQSMTLTTTGAEEVSTTPNGVTAHG